ncbi:efflux RND transporter periplasmic adaptor subunit [Roseateles asaccharophilus]|uniref:RND family efflux transporter MFP subunit n=1 Tax=Roseateles asaccharophilus TaxID=582607 RepID=A0ABU2ACM9_9BURK|nr:efflux RND transporter periplasmic adaptor subunit [Roseateles asaccharophilus]MDR7334949.1 RND family efflux transporter MFP subunit [Roseateles asaccharophilus]
MLKELRIDGAHREDHGGGPPKWVWGMAAGVLVLALVGGAAWWYVAGNKPIAVQTVTVKANGQGGAANVVLQATGYVTARRMATVSAQITGTLTEVLIDEGFKVKKGQVLARLDDTGLRAARAAAQAQVRTAEANLGQLRAQLAQAQADERRQAELSAAGMTTRQSREQAGTAVKTVAAQLEAAQRQIEAAQAQARQADVNFDYATVRAPFDGVVTARAAQVGEIISPLSAGGGFTRTGVGTIVDMDSLEVGVDVNEAYIAQVKPDMPCEAVLDAYPDWRIPARVVAVIPSADRGKATVKVRVALEQKDERVVPDMGVRVSFLAAKPKAEAKPVPGVLLPPDAVVERAGAQVVFAVNEGRAEQRTVKLGGDVGKFRLATEGVKAGETVVVSPPAELKSGSTVISKE